MPLLRGSVAFSRFRVQGQPPKDPKKWIVSALRVRAFEPLDPKGDEDRAAGFVELEDDGRAEFASPDLFYGAHALFRWRVERIRIPAAQVRAKMEEWSRKFEQAEGRPPGRREKTERKEDVRRMLRAQVEPTEKLFDVSWEIATGTLLIWASTRSIVDEIVEALEATLKIKLIAGVPASFVEPDVLDSLSPTPELVGAELEPSNTESSHG